MIYSLAVRFEYLKKILISVDRESIFHMKLYHQSVKLHLRIQDIAIFIEIFQYEMYDNPQLTRGVIFDIGGHIGLFSLYALLKYGVRDDIYIIEPSKENHSILIKNLSAFKNIRVINKALTIHDNGIAFANEGFGHNGKINPDVTGDKIPSISIPSLISKYNIQNIALVKMDIEGHEAEIFNSNKDWLEITDGIILELHDHFSIENLRSIISAYGFSVLPIEKDLVQASKNE